jgi:hypothetical protein
MPTYPWRCFACSASNPANIDVCMVCSCSATTTFSEIQARQAELSKTKQGVAPPSTRNIIWFSQTIDETLVFLAGGAMGGMFHSLLFSKRIATWGHLLNYLVLGIFVVVAAFLAHEKYVQRKKRLSRNKLLLAFLLLGWIVAASWCAKYVR